MKNLLTALWADEFGVVMSAELVLVGTVTAIGAATGLVCIRDAVVDEMTDVSEAIGALDQSYSYRGMQGCESERCGVSSFTASSAYGRKVPVALKVNPPCDLHGKGERSEKRGHCHPPCKGKTPCPNEKQPCEPNAIRVIEPSASTIVIPQPIHRSAPVIQAPISSPVVSYPVQAVPCSPESVTPALRGPSLHAPVQPVYLNDVGVKAQYHVPVQNFGPSIPQQRTYAPKSIGW